MGWRSFAFLSGTIEAASLPMLINMPHSFLYSAAILAWRSLRGRYDLVYVHNMPDILVMSAMVPRLLGAKVILDQHDPMPELMTTIFNMAEKSVGVRVIRSSREMEYGYVQIW